MITKNNSLTSVIGIDVGKTKIQIGIVSEFGKIFHKKYYKMNSDSQEKSIECIHNSLCNFVDQYAGFNVSAVGVGLVGHVDPDKGIWQSAINIPIFKSVPLAEMIHEKIKLPVFLDNDVNSATLAEMQWGVGQKSGDFIYLNVGTGIAMGIVSNSQLYRGVANYAGEAGKMLINSCIGGYHDLETVSSGGGMITQAVDGFHLYPTSVLSELQKRNKLNSSTIFQAADNGDKLAKIVSEQAIEGLGIGTTNILNLFNPEHIVFGGGVFNHKAVISKIKQFVDDYALPVTKKNLKSVRVTELNHNNVGLLGAASVALKNVESYVRE
ncbi:ROK family protein [Bacillus sp. SD088]|uniref:ROK family protein n=1 Tax=Bacillus sp. SD088 TaxID=2782012 RepID=UPI001A9659CC|nr:ROK family protein [Bacillus sp. SD088]MBO0992128.1 ROK family protein [Bacillus sp. SD088]